MYKPKALNLKAIPEDVYNEILKVQSAEKIKAEVEKSVKPELQEQMNTFTPHEGELHVIRVDPTGNYIPNSDFSTSERTYNRTYKDRAGYQLKKSPTKPTK